MIGIAAGKSDISFPFCCSICASMHPKINAIIMPNSIKYKKISTNILFKILILLKYIDLTD